jgi:hypothetical protein
MATMSYNSRSGMPSAVDVDVALARVEVAALRASRGKQLEQRDRSAAQLLHRYYSRKLDAAKNPIPSISKTFVPDEQTRKALPDGLMNLEKAKPEFSGQEELVEQLIGLLSTLANTGHLKPEEGKKLNAIVHTLEARHPEPLGAST